LLLSLLYARRDFVGFAVAPTTSALTVADDHHRGKAEAATAFDHGGTAFDLDDAIEQTVGEALVLRLLLTLATSASASAPAAATAAGV
jgi:hypothetical protein